MGQINRQTDGQTDESQQRLARYGRDIKRQGDDNVD